MSTPPTFGNGALLLDGARHENATAWLYKHLPGHQPWPLLVGTAYEPIADAGPILLEAPFGSPPYEAWKHGSEIMDGVWLESDASISTLLNVLRRRLRIFTPDGNELWLRLGDGRPLYHAWQSGAQWPEGFWHRIDGVWLRGGATAFCAWRNERPQHDLAPAEPSLSAQLTLDWPLLRALANQDDIAQDANS